MYIYKDNITYSDIILNPFVFLETKIEDEFLNLILNLNIPETNGDSIKYCLKDVDKETRLKIVEALLKLPIDQEIKNAIKHFHFDVNKMLKGESVPMHNECGQLSPFEIVFWICPSNDFIGRDFIMNDGIKEERIKPKTGLFCFVNTLVEEVKHGVTELLSDDIIYSITGGLGRKNGLRNK